MICFGLVWLCSGTESAEFAIDPEITLELMMAANYLDT
jgi:transcription elongation factor B subunit 1